MTRRVAFGNTARGVGLYISQPGYDAVAAIDDNLIFSSDWSDSFSIHATGAIVVDSGGNTSGPVTFAAGFTNLGYVPFASFALDPSPPTDGFPAFTPVCLVQSYSRRQGKPWLGINIAPDSLSGQFQYSTLSDGNNNLGWPTAFVLYYAIFRFPLSA